MCERKVCISPLIKYQSRRIYTYQKNPQRERKRERKSKRGARRNNLKFSLFRSNSIYLHTLVVYLHTLVVYLQVKLVQEHQISTFFRRCLDHRQLLNGNKQYSSVIYSVSITQSDKHDLYQHDLSDLSIDLNIFLSLYISICL